MKLDYFLLGMIAGFAVGTVLIALVTMGSESANRSSGYRQGQIDALNGVIKYKLQEQDDGAVTWEAVDE